MFEVQQFLYGNTWENTWHEYDDDNNEVPMIFDSFEDALDELDVFLSDCDKEYKRGNIDAPYNRSEFRIVSLEPITEDQKIMAIKQINKGADHV